MERIKLYPALKHGAYCSSSLLPGEDPVAFERLHKDLTEEFEPNGALEEDIVATITRLVWRKRHLTTFRNAQIAQDRWFTIQAEKRLQVQAEKRLYGEDVPELEMLRAAAAQVRKELGDTYDSVKLGKTPTFDHLLNELAVEERLDAPDRQIFETFGAC